MTTLRELQKSSYAVSSKSGFHELDGQVLSSREVFSLQTSRRLLLTVSELVEAFECQRDGVGDVDVWWHCKQCGFDSEPFDASLLTSAVTTESYSLHCDVPMKLEGFPVECADAIIRIADLAESVGFDLDSLVTHKEWYNSLRERLHGKQF